MFATRSLLQACRVTLFTRDNCGLCSQAKDVLGKVWDTKPFLYREIDVDGPDSKAWRNVYDFDVPVVHVSKLEAGDEDISRVGKALKLMHRFTAEQLEQKMDEVEQR